MCCFIILTNKLNSIDSQSLLSENILVSRSSITTHLFWIEGVSISKISSLSKKYMHLEGKTILEYNTTVRIGIHVRFSKSSIKTNTLCQIVIKKEIPISFFARTLVLRNRHLAGYFHNHYNRDLFKCRVNCYLSFVT